MAGLVSKHCSSNSTSFARFYEDPRQLDFFFESDRDVSDDGFRCQYELSTDRNQGDD